MGSLVFTVLLLGATEAVGRNPISLNNQMFESFETDVDSRSEISVRDERVVSAAQYATDTMEAQSNSLEKYTLENILAALPLFLEDEGYEIDVQLQGNLGTTRFVKTNVVWDKSRQNMMVKSFHTVFTIVSPSEEPIQSPFQESQMAGGFKCILTNSTDARRAALELARKKENLVEGAKLVLCKVASQVVAGMNYKLSIGIGNCENTFTGIVFRSLQGEYLATLRAVTF